MARHAGQDPKIRCWGWQGCCTFLPFAAALVGCAESHPVRYPAPPQAVTAPAPLATPGAPSPVRQSIAAGTMLNCAVDASAQVRCFRFIDQPSVPIRTKDGAPIADAVRVAVGFDHGCLIRRDTSVWCWGNNAGSALGAAYPRQLPRTDGAVAVRGPGGSGTLSGIAQVYATAGASCAVGTAGQVFCWGAGMNEVYSSTNTYAFPVSLGTLDVSGPVGLAMGYENYCRWQNSEVNCLGRGATTGLVPYRPSRRIVDVASANTHHCAVLDDGALECFGHEERGSLGTGSPRRGDDLSSAPVVDERGQPLGQAVRVVAAGESSCALMADSSVRCWGANRAGQLGNGNLADQPFASTVSMEGSATPLTSVIDIAMGGGHACALRADRSVYCWGAVTRDGPPVTAARRSSG